VMLFCDSAQFT